MVCPHVTHKACHFKGYLPVVKHGLLEDFPFSSLIFPAMTPQKKKTDFPAARHVWVPEGKLHNIPIDPRLIIPPCFLVKSCYIIEYGRVAHFCQWIGGKIFTGKPWVFTIKYRGFPLNFKVFPIIQFCGGIQINICVHRFPIPISEFLENHHLDSGQTMTSPYHNVCLIRLPRKQRQHHGMAQRRPAVRGRGTVTRVPTNGRWISSWISVIS